MTYQLGKDSKRDFCARIKNNNFLKIYKKESGDVNFQISRNLSRTGNFEIPGILNVKKKTGKLSKNLEACMEA